MVRTVIEVNWIPSNNGNPQEGQYSISSLLKQPSIAYARDIKELKTILRFYEEEHDSSDTLGFMTTERFREKTGYDGIVEMMNN